MREGGGGENPCRISPIARWGGAKKRPKTSRLPRLRRVATTTTTTTAPPPPTHSITIPPLPQNSHLRNIPSSSASSSTSRCASLFLLPRCRPAGDGSNRSPHPRCEALRGGRGEERKQWRRYGSLTFETRSVGHDEIGRRRRCGR